MSRLRAAAARIRGFFGRRDEEQGLSDEVRAHLELLTEENQRRGMSAEEAMYAARRQFGGVEQTKEAWREQRGLPWLDALLQDVRFALRMLRKSPGFTAVGALTLALGIGANSAIFSVVNSVVLRPLPLKSADRLVVLGERNPKVSRDTVGASFANFTDWRRQNRSFEQVSAYRERRLTLTGRGEPRRISALGVSDSFYALLGENAYLGRTFRPEEERPSQSGVVVLGYGFWKDVFAGDPRAIGQTLVLENQPRTIIGVLGPGFHFLQDAQVFTPLDLPVSVTNLRGMRFLRVLARLKPGVSVRQAQADMDGIAEQLARDYAQWDEGWGVAVTPLKDKLLGRAQQALLVLLGAVGLVLLIACANVAGLTLARGSSRRREMAVRAALGASRGRMVRMLLTESLLLAVLSGGVAVALAYWGTNAVRAASASLLPRAAEVNVDGRVLLFTLMVTILAGLLFGIAPARQALRVNLQETLKEGARASASSGARLRGILVTSQVALSVVLLAGAGLLGHSLYRMLAQNPGFRAAGVLSFEIPLPASRYPKENQMVNFYRELLDRAGKLPGVHSVALTTAVPLSGMESRNSFGIEGRKAEDAEWAVLWTVSPSYFRTMGIPLLRGRTFAEGDGAAAPPVAVINEAMARKYWSGDNPIGGRLQFGDPGPVIIGVVGNVKASGLADSAEPEIYVSLWQQPENQAALVARADGDPLALVAPLRALVQSLDKDQPIERIQTIENLLSQSVAQPRLLAVLLGSFSALSLMLVAVGLYGLLSYSVSQRAHEIGIRMALGASRADVLGLVLGGGFRLVGFGAGAGLIVALVATRVLRSLLFQVRATDPWTFAGVASVLVLVALTACYLPARRATRVDPIIALRYE